MNTTTLLNEMLFVVSLFGLLLTALISVIANFRSSSRYDRVFFTAIAVVSLIVAYANFITRFTK